ncbi:hypothetical protein ACXM0N_09640 [Peribacillus simplex]
MFETPIILIPDGEHFGIKMLINIFTGIIFFAGTILGIKKDKHQQKVQPILEVKFPVHFALTHMIIDTIRRQVGLIFTLSALAINFNKTNTESVMVFFLPQC